jgi:RNA polymerase sigma factor (sigma-70 family)
VSKVWDEHLEALMTQRYHQLVGRARLLGASAELAEDVVQASLISAFSRSRGFKSLGEAEAYVKRVIAHEYIDSVVRKRKGEAKLEAMGNAAPVAVVGTDNAIENKIDISAALATLPPRERACLVLRYVDDLTTEQTAQTLGLSAGAVKRYVHDGLARLNGSLGSTFGEPAPVTVAVYQGGKR